jgi:hypothetical protein
LVLGVWEEVLGVGVDGVDVNFFEAGGHSLLLFEVLGRLRDATGARLTIPALLEGPTVRGHASAIAAARAESEVVPERKPAPSSARAPVRLERRIAAGQLPALDSAALTVLPATWAAGDSERSSLLAQEPDGWPLLATIYDMQPGRVGVFTLPMFDDEVLAQPERVCQAIASAVDVATGLGARRVGLTGLLSAATGHGRTAPDAIAGMVTTGHASTVACIVLAIEAVLEETGRSLAGEQLAILGVGSIGSATVESILLRAARPQRLLLCDVEARRSTVEQLAERLQRRGLAGPIEIVTSAGLAHADVYRATLIVGATSLPGILDVDQLVPGTIVIDDSHPHAFDVRAALTRMATARDVLCLDAGVLRWPRPVLETDYSPAWLPTFDEAARRADTEVMACMAAPLAPSAQPGMPIATDCLNELARLSAVGCGPARPRCGGIPVSPGLMRAIAARPRS